MLIYLSSLQCYVNRESFLDIFEPLLFVYLQFLVLISGYFAVVCLSTVFSSGYFAVVCLSTFFISGYFVVVYLSTVFDYLQFFSSFLAASLPFVYLQFLIQKGNKQYGERENVYIFGAKYGQDDTALLGWMHKLRHRLTL
jgi:hypothetical protein